MTVEATERKTHISLLGLRRRTETETRVVDFRKTKKRLGEGGVEIHTGVGRSTFDLKQDYDKGTNTVAKITSEDEIEVFDWDRNIGGAVNHRVYQEDEINEAGLEREDGSIKLTLFKKQAQYLVN